MASGAAEAALGAAAELLPPAAARLRGVSAARLRGVSACWDLRCELRGALRWLGGGDSLSLLLNPRAFRCGRLLDSCAFDLVVRAGGIRAASPKSQVAWWVARKRLFRRVSVNFSRSLCFVTDGAPCLNGFSKINGPCRPSA